MYKLHSVVQYAVEVDNKNNIAKAKILNLLSIILLFIFLHNSLLTEHKQCFTSPARTTAASSCTWATTTPHLTTTPALWHHLLLHHVDNLIWDPQVLDGAAANVALRHAPEPVTILHDETETHTHTHTHTLPFNGPFSGTAHVSRYQKGKTNLDFTEARDSEWEWHQLGHMQVSTSLQTDNHASTPPLSFLQAGCPSCCPTNIIKALNAQDRDRHGSKTDASFRAPIPSHRGLTLTLLSNVNWLIDDC